MPPSPSPVPSPTPHPTNSVDAAIQAREILEANARAQFEAAQQRAREAQVQNVITTVGGNQVMDSVLGLGGSSAGAGALSSGAGAGAVGSHISGGTMMADGSVAAMSPGTAVGAAPTGIGAAGNFALPVAGALGGYDLLTSDYGPGRGALQGAASGAAIGSYFGPVGTGIGAGIGGTIGLVKGLTKHESTKEAEQRRWGSLGKKGSWGSSTPEVIQLARESHPEGDTGQNWTPEVAAAAMKDPTQMWGSYGMLNTFGPDYFDKMNEFQRYAATKAAIDNGLLDADKGDIIVTDEKKLRELLPAAYTNEQYQQEYNAWKKANPNVIQPQGAEAGTQGGSQYRDFDSMMSSALAGISANAQAEVKAQKKQDLMQMAARPINTPQIQSSPIRTGVQDLDNILGSVLG